MTDEHDENGLNRPVEESYGNPYEQPSGDEGVPDSGSDENGPTVGDQATQGHSGEAPQAPSPQTHNAATQERTQQEPLRGLPLTPKGFEDVSSGEQPTQALQPQSAEVSAQYPSDPTSQPEPASQSEPIPQYQAAPEYGAYTPAAAQGQPGSPQYGQLPEKYYPFGTADSGQNQANGQPQGQPGQPTNEPTQIQDRNPYVTGNPFTSPGYKPSDQGAPGFNGNQTQPEGQRQSQPQGQGSAFPPPNPPSGLGQFAQGNGAPQAPATRKGSNTILIAVLAAVLSAAVCLGIGFAAITNGWVTVPTTSSMADINSNTSGEGSTTVQNDEKSDWTSTAASVSPSVVSIQTVVSDGTAMGSGAIIDPAGYIVTNNHVISGANQIQVTLSNGQMYSAQITGVDTTTDLAVIKLDNPPDDLKAATFADSSKLAVGEPVMAIGNPLGYDDTATTGIVSALNRPVSVSDGNDTEIVTNAVQIDAAINRGNSGGPTFNAAGEVIGINSSIASTATNSDEVGSIGIGFAIPSNLVNRVATEIIESGSATHVALGITITSTTVEADGVTRGGAQITASGGSGVVSGSPADKAGLKTGDTIVAFNGNAVSNNYSLLGFVRAAALGDKVTLTIVRGGNTMDVDVTLDQTEATSTGSGTEGNDDGDDDDGDDDGDDGFYDPFGFW